MGDMILTLPIIKSIKIQNPKFEIHVLASVFNAKVLINIKYIDEIFPNQLDIILHMETYPVYKTADLYVGYCTKHLFVAMASQYNDSDYNFDLSTNEQIRFMYDFYALYEYDGYHLDDDADKSKWRKLETFRNRAVPKEYKSSYRSKKKSNLT